MIYYIFYELLFKSLSARASGESYFVKALNVFQYVTFRTAYATVTALLISLVFGGRVIRRCASLNVGQQIREEGPQAHMAKRGTPTMGGVLIIGSVLISTLLWARLRTSMSGSFWSRPRSSPPSAFWTTTRRSRSGRASG